MGPPDRPTADGWEVDKLLDTVNATLDVNLQRADIVGTYAGLRPLIAPSGGSTVKASREHRVTVEPSGVVRIGGGKYTTYRVMARDVVDAALGREVAKQRPSETAEHRLIGAADRPALDRLAGELATVPEIAAAHPEAAARLVARHGTQAPAVVAVGAELDLLRPLVAGRPFLEAEVAWAVRHELALSVDDVLSRRLRLSPELADRGASVAPRVASIMAARPRLGPVARSTGGRDLPDQRAARIRRGATGRTRRGRGGTDPGGGTGLIGRHIPVIEGGHHRHHAFDR